MSKIAQQNNQKMHNKTVKICTMNIEKNKKIIPENTKIQKYYMEGDCLYLDFSSEFLNYNKEEKDIMIKCIVNTLTELTEINSVKILVEGEQVEDFPEVYTRTEVNA